MSPLMRRIIQEYPDEANKLVREFRKGNFVKITTEDGTVRYIGPSSAGKPSRDKIVEIDLSASTPRTPRVPA